MDDMKMLKRARHYMMAMAAGIDPCTGEFVPEGDTVSNARVQNCCGYVANILAVLIARESLPDSVSASVPEDFSIEPQDEPLTIKELVRHINKQLPQSMKRVTASKITNWLAGRGYLTAETDAGGKKYHLLNARSSEAGIIEGFEAPGDKSRSCPLYTPEAQEYILDNIEEIVSYRRHK